MTTIETKLKALAFARKAVEDAIDALSDGPGTWNREQDQLANIKDKLFDMDYELGYEYRDEQREQGQREDVAPDPLEYWETRG